MQTIPKRIGRHEHKNHVLICDFMNVNTTTQPEICKSQTTSYTDKAVLYLLMNVYTIVHLLQVGFYFGFIQGKSHKV